MTGYPTFTLFFAALHDGNEPYEWQKDLATKLAVHGTWPWHIDVPTGLGKTATIANAVYELARQCHEGVPRTAPQRIFHVVDRRTIIDSTAEYAEHIAEQINLAPEGPLRTVRDALGSLLGPGDDFALVTDSIHGDSADDRRWLRAAGCSIVSLSSHQFVSRLLLRGYGVNPGVRSIAAGLCAIDRLVLFDEPHLSAQSVHTILATERLQARAIRDLGVPQSQTSLLGATVDTKLTDLGGTILSLDPCRETAEAARRRLETQRIARIDWSGDTDANVEKLMVAATQEARRSGAERIVVFTNTVGMAQAIHRKLSKSANEDAPVTLLTSRFRPHDKPILPNVGIVVATQTLEVGVDISFDALITEVCPWDALVQRLGRLNRDGHSDHGTATVIAGWDENTDSPASRKATNAVYGEERILAATRLMRKLDEESDDGLIDLGFTGLRELRARPDIDHEELVGNQNRIGTLTSAMLPILAQTRPIPEPDVPIDALITGPDAPIANEVSIAWRERLDVFDSRTDAPRIDPMEVVAVPRSALALFLQGKAKATATMHDGVGDVEIGRESGPLPFALDQFRTWRSSSETWEIPRSIRDVVTAVRVVMKPALGGYDKVLGWTGNRTDEGSNLDISISVAVKAISHMGRSRLPTKVDLVLSPSSLDQLEVLTDDFDVSPLRAEFSVLKRKSEGGIPVDDLDVSLLIEAASDFAEALAQKGASDREQVRQVTVLTCHPSVVVVRIQSARRIEVQNSHELVAHQRQTASWASADARNVGLESGLVGSVATAALHHDEGKRRREFQLHLGAFEGSSSAVVLAKSGRRLSRAEELRRLRLVGIEDGWRHEAESVMMANLPLLERHLVGSHHGWFRPVLRPIRRVVPPDEPIYPGALEHADEFAELNRLYGVWGLAYLEAILRLADWRASARPSNGFEAPEAFTAKTNESRSQVKNQVPELLAEPTTTALTGLHTHPLTGWFAAVGLLAATQEDDPYARLHWSTLYASQYALPVVPVLRSAVPVAELVDRIHSDPQWDEAEKLLGLHTTGRSLGVKSQKLHPARNLRGLLSESEAAENEIVLTLGNDLVASEGEKVVMPLVPIANNASYPKIAIDRISEKRREGSAEEAYLTLTTMTAGFGNNPCDGGMDRSLAESPVVNGLGDVMTRQTRSALAPLVLYGIAKIGAGPVRGIGVSDRTRELILPMPTEALTFHELQALTFIGRGRVNWDWAGVGLQWVYMARHQKPTKYESIWRGGVQHRRQTE